MDYTEILQKPLVTEKTTVLKNEQNQVVFQVHPAANKLQVAKAVEEAFDVRVAKVNMVTKKPRERKRFGRIMGKKAGLKKAYISLVPGDKIEYFEGV